MNAHRFLILLGVSSAALGACALFTDHRSDVDCLIEENAGMFWNTDGCLKLAKEYCTMNADGGPDAEQPDADACRQAGFPVKPQGLRMGRCGPAAPHGFSEPESVWFGEVSKLPNRCPPGVGSASTPYYSDVKEPNANTCAKCACGDPTGSCALAVDHLAFRNATCDLTASVTTEITPPANWNGTCSSDAVIAKGAECPPGSGIPCVQSLEIAPLPKPTEGCLPAPGPKPIAIVDGPQWTRATLSCRSEAKAPSLTLLNILTKGGKPPEHFNTCISHDAGWRTCVLAEAPGVVACDKWSPYKDQMVVYEYDALQDNRSCSPCTCAPAGGSCVATLSLYEDNDCKEVLSVTTMDSDNAYCTNTPSTNGAFGSKEVTNLDYVPGTCIPGGGELSGHVETDETLAHTWCCLTPDDENKDDVYDIDQ